MILLLVFGRGRYPSGSSRRCVLNQATHSRVDYSTSSRPRQGPAWRMSSVLNNPITDSASALSYESPRLPTEGFDARLRQPLGVPNRQTLHAPVAVIHKARVGLAIVEGLLQGIEREIARQRAGGPPAHDPPGGARSQK